MQEGQAYRTDGSADFLVSYNTADEKWAELIADTLELLGYSVLIQAWDFRTGENFVLKIHDALTRTRRTAVVLSRHYLNAEYTHPEWAGTFVKDPRGEQRRLLPFRVDDCVPPGLLSAIIYTDLFGMTEDEARRRVEETVADLASIDSVKPGAAAAPLVERSDIQARLQVARPGLLRYLLDRASPRLHSMLSRVGTFSCPDELRDLQLHLASVTSSIDHSLHELRYLPLDARQVLPRPPSPLSRDEVAPIVQREIREILDTSRGGDATNAQLALVNQRSRVVRNILRFILRATQPLVLLGDPGSGKTMTLQVAARSLAAHEQKRVFPKLVVYVRLGEFHVSGKVTPDHVYEYVKAELPRAIQVRFDSLLNAHRVIVLFDGMDEMSRERFGEHVEALSLFALRHKSQAETLFSCRINDFSPRFIHKQLVLLPFNRAQIREYLRAYLPVSRALLIDGRKWTLPELARYLSTENLALNVTNPFILWLLCFHLQQTQSWPAARVELLATYVGRLFEAKRLELADQDEPFLSLDETRSGLAHIAFLITERNAGSSILLAEVHRVRATTDESWRHLRSLVYTGTRCGLLVQVSTKQGNQIRFAHHRLQEYFAALHVHCSGVSVRWLDKLDAPRWQETMINLLAMGEALNAADALANAIRVEIGERNVMETPAKDRKRWRRRNTASLSPPVSDGEESFGAIGMDEHREALLGDRIELGARILGECSSQHANVGMTLRPVLERALVYVMKVGNPTSQVKLLMATRNVQGLDPMHVIQRPLNSRIAWVRSQALIALTGSHGGAHSLGANLANELALDIARSVLLKQLPSYWKAFRQGARSQTWLLVAGVLGQTLPVVALLVVSAALYVQFPNLLNRGLELEQPVPSLLSERETVKTPSRSFLVKPRERVVPGDGRDDVFILPSKVRQQSQTATWFDNIVAIWRSPIAISIFAGGLLMSAVITLRRDPTRAWAWIPLTAFAMLISVCFVECAAEGMLGMMWKLALGSIAVVFGGGVILAVMVLLVQGCVLAAFTLPLGDSARRWEVMRTLLKVAWETSRFGALLEGVVGYLVGPLIAVTFLLLRHWLSAGPALLAMIGLAVVACVLSRSLREFVLDTLVFNLKHRPWSVARGFLLAGAAIFVCLLLLVIAGVFVAPLLRGSEAGIAQGMGVLFLLVAIGVGGWLLLRVAREMVSGRRRLTADRISPAEWKLLLMDQTSAAKQARLLETTSQETLGQTVVEFLGTLYEVESVIKEDPASSVYWQKRFELQEGLKQERRG